VRNEKWRKRCAHSILKAAERRSTRSRSRCDGRSRHCRPAPEGAGFARYDAEQALRTVCSAGPCCVSATMGRPTQIKGAQHEERSRPFTRCASQVLAVPRQRWEDRPKLRGRITGSGARAPNQKRAKPAPYGAGYAACRERPAAPYPFPCASQRRRAELKIRRNGGSDRNAAKRLP